MRDDRARNAALRRQLAAGTLGLVCLLTVDCSRHKFVRSENPQPDIEIRVNGSPMTVRSAVVLNDGARYLVMFFTREVNCSELTRGLDRGGDDAVEVGIWPRPDSVFVLLVGGKPAGRSIHEPKVAVTEIQSSPNSLWTDELEGNLDVATSMLQIRGKFTARGCGADLRVLNSSK